ncbi:MAG: hypothetical protein JRI23_19000 [Deltaproteobacteria bacterium]|jgi:hypothetical protein|nr:hypothetical protein [Deltaproteobacteria bacterium]MBW2533953.1 hypothetical protein [Deltaproteobacteria bacterium]
MDDYQRLHALLSATEPFSESGEGGSHTDVLQFDGDRLRANVAGSLGTERLPAGAERLVEELSDRYLVKKGKIHYFSMAVTGAETNHIRRNVVSWAFGPVGYNLMPTWDKTTIDAHEAARLIPFFGCGDPAGVFAPDFLRWLESAPESDEIPKNEDGTFLRTVLRGAAVDRTAFDLLDDDEYFHARSRNQAELADFQRFVRRNPLGATMRQRLSDFFEAPITVGVRDTMRWFRGSRHHSMPWDRAQGIIEQCFERHGTDNFLLPEINYYSYDTSYSPKQLETVWQRNQVVAQAFAQRLEDALTGKAHTAWRARNGQQLAFELLDFHHDYPLYEVEPYAGFLSGMMLRFLARFSWGVLVQATGLKEPEVRNVDLGRLPEFHASFVGLLASLEPGERERFIDTVQHVLGADYRRGLTDAAGERLWFERIPRTFYTFQQKADRPSSGRRVVGVHQLDELWQEDHAGIWQRYPELAEKLVVFFTLIYRYYADTGFIADLRPRDAGRDIFIYGIWGYVTENLLIVEELDERGEAQVRVVFVDNRDQFKEYRREEDRRKPLGPAKYALRLIHPLIEPAMQRGIGIFVNKVAEATFGTQPDRPLGPLTAAERGLDVARTVVQKSVDSTFVNTKAVVDDLVDDLHTGARRTLADVVRKLERMSRK